MSTTEHWRAPEVKRIADTLIPKHHLHLNRPDIEIRYLFRTPAARSRGRLVYGRAKKISGLNAYLVRLEHTDRVEDDELVDFFVVEIAYDPWQSLTPDQRVALVDHELCHLDIELTDKGDTKLGMRGHDLEEFREVVQRHGLWRPALAEFTEVAKGAQLAFPINAGGAGDVIRNGSNARTGAALASTTDPLAAENIVATVQDMATDTLLDTGLLRPADDGDPAPVDAEMLAQAAELVVDAQFASTSFVQRKLQIGFATAGRVMAQLEQLGVVGPQDGTRQRDTLVPPEGLAAVLDRIRARS